VIIAFSIHYTYKYGGLYKIKSHFDERGEFLTSKIAGNRRKGYKYPPARSSNMNK